jgi:hypothetical protein
MTAVATGAQERRAWYQPSLSNWRLALALAAVVIPGSIFVLPMESA